MRQPSKVGKVGIKLSKRMMEASQKMNEAMKILDEVYFKLRQMEKNEMLINKETLEKT